MRMSSVAMMTASKALARQHRSQTRWRSGLFAMRCSGFPGNRVELQRAGMIPTALLIGPVQNDLRCCRQILGDPISAATVRHLIKAGPYPDRSDTGVVRAFGVDLLVSD